jgi:hypothetical protein
VGKTFGIIARESRKSTPMFLGTPLPIRVFGVISGHFPEASPQFGSIAVPFPRLNLAPAFRFQLILNVVPLKPSNDSE